MSLLPVARIVANGALRLGGSQILWYKAIPCPNRRPDGSPCYDEDAGSNWVDCSVCRGQGMTYAQKRPILGIYTDNSNEFVPDGSGGWMQGKKTLSVEAGLPITMMKEVMDSFGNGNRLVLKDKFVIFGVDGRVAEIVYLQSDPIKPTINSGEIYSILEVRGNG